MNKKIAIMGLLAVFMLVSISFVSSATISTDVEKKESPLWKIRTSKAITEKITNIIDNIRTKFLGDRIFLLPFKWLRNGGFLSEREQVAYSLKIGCTYRETECSVCPTQVSTSSCNCNQEPIITEVEPTKCEVTCHGLICK